MLSDKDFKSLVDFLTDLRICFGPEFVNSSINRHPVIKRALLDYCKTRIVDIESALSN